MKHDYQNPALSPEQRAEDLLALMTMEEKIGQMVQISYSRVTRAEARDWVTRRGAGSFLHVLGEDAKELQDLTIVTRLGIPLIFGIDAIHGHALHNGATVFPSQLGMACSWNPELIKEAGRVTAKEVLADGLHWTFSPVLCIGRDLRWGRIDETFGEDPYLIGVLAAAIIRGYQGENLANPDGILACAKHFLGYGESTGGRDSYDTKVSIRKIREVFLPPFAQALAVGCATFMAGYQSIDSIPTSANGTLLRKILKDELGFKGFVVTDWDNTGSLITNQKMVADMREASREVIEAGNDMIMNTPAFYDAALEITKQGVIPEQLVDQAVKRILTIKFAMGLFEDKRRIDLASRSQVFACPEHLDVNLRLTRESMVLLENRNHTLPLGSQVKKIAVIGPNADNIKAQFGDWTFFSHPEPSPEAVPILHVYTMLDGIRELAATKGVEVLYHRGCDVMNPGDQDIPGAIICANQADVIVAVIGDCLAQNGETKDRADLSLSGAQLQLLESLQSCKKPLIVVLVNGKPLAIPWVAQNAAAVIETFNSGLLGGKALAEILFGEINPSGRLPISFPYHSGQLPVYYNQLPGWHGEKYMDLPAEPLYSFGYGLSYTQFSYDKLQLSRATCTAKDTVNVSVELTNCGDREGIETVQLYVNDCISSVVTPVKELKGFQRVALKAGETRTVTIPLSIAQLALVDQGEHYRVEPGEFEIMVGPDSRDQVLLKTVLTVVSEG